jgi:lipoyl(octanoyl) transferase
LSNNDNEINYYFLGRQQFTPIWELQETIHQKRIHNEINDVVLLLEHEHVYTFGKNADQNHLLPSYPSDTDVVQIDRGGDVTYHGPGQLIVYPIIDLHNYKLSVSWYMRTLEQTIIDVLSQYNIQSQRNDKLTGVWIEDEKICAMGVRLAKWVTMHGLALNNNPNMQYFDGMIPCGIFECGVTSIYEINQQAKTIIDLATEVGNLLHSHLMKERN